jgi:hypothetical protein
MKHFEQQALSQLKITAQLFYSAIDKADKWVSKNLENEQQESVAIKLKNKRRIVRKIVDSIDSKPVFALFGGSQVGKSYLVKNILSIDGAPLTIQLGGREIDFLKDINPAGTGAESTGVVTRFTIDQASPFDDYPVRSKLLNTKDIILIICDSFFSDLRSIDYYPSPEEFNAHCQKLVQRFAASSASQDRLVEDDIFDIKDYFDKNFYSFKFYTDKINQSNYWFEVGRLIATVPVDNWDDVFSILWCNNKGYSELFKLLINELRKINFMQEVFLEANTVLRGHGEILDVQRLKELFSQASMGKGKSKEGQAFELNISIISALSREVSLTCDPRLAEKKPFLNNTDLLDFPGARSRLEHTFDSITTEAIPDLYLRGKVAYLFNKYSGDYEINNLLFCQNDKQLDVNELPSLLNAWILNNIGSDAIDREKNLASLPVSPLFIIFTFFNNQLKFDTTNDDKEDINYKWNTRFTRFFEQELVTVNHDWHRSWTTSSPLFKNFYLLRDYKYSADMFTGFEDVGTETGIQSHRTAFLDRLKQSFIDYDFVKKHFENPEISFDQAALPNQDGGQRIINNLAPAANNFVKIKNYTTQMLHLQNDFTYLLSKYHYTDDIDEMRKRAISNSLKVQLEMNRIFSQHQEYFNRFLELFMLDEAQLFNYLHDNLKSAVVNEGSTTEYDLFKSSFPDLDDNLSAEKNLEIMKSALGLGTIDEVIHILEEQGLEMDKLFPKHKKNSSSDSILNGVMTLWQHQINEGAAEEFKRMGFSSDVIKIIREAYERAFEFNDFNSFLKSVIKEKYQGISLDSEAEEYLAAVLSQYFNEFIGQFGVNDLSQDVFDNVETLQPQLKTYVKQFLMPRVTPSSDVLVNLFDKLGEDTLHINDTNAMVEGYNSYLNKFKIAVLSNCGFVHYDIEQNNELNQLIQTAKDFNFEIN